MKFFYILTKNMELVGSGFLNNEKQELLDSIFYDFKQHSPLNNKIYSITLNREKALSIIIDLLSKRTAIDVPDFQGRFSESEIFENRTFMGKDLKLCNSGFDNQIIFLIDLIDSICENGFNYYLILSANHKEYYDIVGNLRKLY